MSADSWVSSKFNEDDLKTHGAIFLQKNCITSFIAKCNPWPLTTGSILYITNFEKASPFNIKRHYKWGEIFHDPLISDDKSLIASVKDRDLVILTAHDHAGIINAIK